MRASRRTASPDDIGIPMSRGHQSGQIELVILIAIVILFAYFASGGLFPRRDATQGQLATIPISSSSCCENAECSPLRDDANSFLYEGPGTGRGKRYGLLKRNVTLTEYNAHLEDSGSTFGGDPIVLNTSDGFYFFVQRFAPGNEGLECGLGTDDQLWSSPDPNASCVPIRNDVLLYVCRANCTPTDRQAYRLCRDWPQIPCYGRLDSIYDVYYSITDYDADGSVPDVIRNCPGASTTAALPQTTRIIVAPSPNPNPNLQLENLEFIEIPLQPSSTSWLSPYCKPAIYLYPQQRTDVNVLIAPKGKLTLAIPKYSQSGWSVTANPSGVINYQNGTYDYLYYEAEIPDSLIEKPNEGFVVKYEELVTLFNDLLPKLGLNEKESSQFSEYWLKALSNSSYYFVGVVAQNNLNFIAPITINPSPHTIIRVTLYFQALEQNVRVTNPMITTPKRDGFTMVEWGGIVKTDENHLFSCLM